ncbi:hypothetical protein [Bacteroides sp. Marseille-P3684]|uniref:hypothetical protein n=1 Tax=Bacteroides sp. Marseille-P3684 TaxID=2086579 RepID=UPI001F27F93F|nr:hypothetical protein [Bacteroides sp. Marseille-P3684]
MTRPRIIHLALGIFLFMMGSHAVSAQNVEEIIEFRKKKPFKISGSFTANATQFSSTPKQSRQSFTYQLTGSINMSLYELLDIPLSFNLNNYGAQVSYPSLPNRLSLHPSYKWIRLHVGDVSMNFNPYTLNGHQFTGVGAELTPGKWKISAMGGRLLKRVEADSSNPAVRPNYERWGYGAKVRYEHDKFAFGGTFFTAKDKMEDISFEADARGILPQGNVALGLEGSLSIIKNLKLSFEYGVSFMQRDLRIKETQDYHAFKSDLSYTFLGNSISLGYERISPEYETLGAYYFNNDYENLTLNYGRSLFDNKLSIALSGGVQRDDLSGDKQESNKRFVGSASISYTPGERFSASVAISSYQAHRNIKSSFDYINERTPYENLDTLRFTQLSNSIEMNLNWHVKKTDKQTHILSANAGYQEAADRQGDYIMPGNLTRFLNVGTNYSIDFIPADLSLVAGVNISNNYMSRKNVLTMGPILTCYKRLFDKAVTTGLTVSSNRTLDEGKRMADIYNVRWHASYRFLKRHGLNAGLSYQHRSLADPARQRTSSFTSQISYSYSF